MQILTEIEINAEADKIWQTIIDFAAYDSWNPIMQKVTGKPHKGDEVSFSIVVLPGVFLPITACKVLVADAKERHLRWKGPAIPIVKEVLSGEHFFMVQEKSPGKCRFIHGENFTGIMAPILNPVLSQRLTALYGQMNQALKIRCEEYSA
ncbi:MAG: hypothetical protein LDLANPLL_02630 [Turneriella sp.]|nr:hypothetical protein [Turneriella sp.]